MAEREPLIQILRTPPRADGAPRKGGVEWTGVAERLRQFAEARVQPGAEERCELCSAGVSPDHGHLVDLAGRGILCVCRPCYLLFTHDGAGGARFRAVPERYERLSGFAAALDAWRALDLPTGLAFLFRNGGSGRVAAFYPSPAGAIESELALEAWNDLVAEVPRLATMEADVEALLVRKWEDTVTALIVPIDVCYELVGRIRMAWSGIHGGGNVWGEIDAFFARAASRSPRGVPA